MPFKFEPSAQMQQEGRRVANERLDRAITRLDGFETMVPAEIETSVHGVRKRCKEVRALARLVRDPLGSGWTRFNALVRDASYELSPIRDAHAVLATLDHLLSASNSQDDADLQTVRSTLAHAATDATRGVQGQNHRITNASELLTAARRDVSGWDIEDGSEWLTIGFSNTYDRGRKGMRRARERPTDDRMHEWRKAVKTLWYQVRLVEAAAPSVLTPLIAHQDEKYRP
jgi:CHAD domain-containing protein